jgi:hypothetical protein
VFLGAMIVYSSAYKYGLFYDQYFRINRTSESAGHAVQLENKINNNQGKVFLALAQI